MPINKIRSSSRAKAAIAAVILSASATGWLAFFSPDRITPASVHAAIEQGITPPAVELAVNKLIIPWEGLVLQSHWDSFAKIWDICYGETRINGKPVTAGMSFTPAECLAMLKVRVINDYYLPLVDGVKGYVEAPVSLQASLLSGAYNFGVSAAKRSTAASLTTAGKYRQACEAQTAFNRAGGRIVNGLVLRREMGDKERLGEAELCVSGL
ncbi:lysozyme [Phyllobacterium sp. P5_D12]